MNAKKGGLTTQKIKRLEMEVERLKELLNEQYQLVEFWRDNLNMQYQQNYFHLQPRKPVG